MSIGITPPRVKLELHAYGEVHDFSNSIDNWKHIEITQKRDKTSGVIFQVTFPFEFVLDAYDVVKDIFDKYQYRAVGDMYIYLLKDRWPYEKEQYHEPQIYNLDWTSYDRCDNKIEIDTDQNRLYDIVKAKNKIVYDIPVREIREDKPWDFQRIQLENSITFRAVNDNFKESRGPVQHYMVGITNEASEISVKDRIEMNTVPDLAVFREDLFFMEVNKLPLESQIKLNIDISSSITDVNSYPLSGVVEATMFLTKEYDTSDPWKDAIATKDYSFPAQSVSMEWKEELAVDITAGDKFYLVLAFRTISIGRPVKYLVKTEGAIKAMYQAQNEPLAIDLIDPKTLLQSLVDSMTRTTGKYTTDIEDFNPDSNNLIMLSAAESIRGIKTKKDREGKIINEPKVHTSYRKFVEWMNTYGYEQHVAGDKVAFKKRRNSFRPDVTAIELGARECADLREMVDTDYLYSGLKIGYQRKDIENTNVRFEFNGTHDYGTDLNLGEHLLELISPYRADCYGIEFLALERGKDSTDDKSDKDLFLVNVSAGDTNYTTVKNELSGNYPNDTIFNANLNPYYLMLMNEDLLGIGAKRVTFAASDSNANIVIDEKPINADYDIPEDVGLFEPIIYNIASKNIQNLPSGDDAHGLVRFDYRGKIHEGYIAEIAKNMAWELETTWILRKKKGAS